jgi:glucose-1-phosphate adenylyltransferase
LIARHEARGSVLTMVTTRSPDDEPERHGIVDVDDSGRVRAVEARREGGPGTPVAASIYLFRGRDLLARLADPSLGPDLVADVIRPMIEEDLPVHAEPFDGYWHDVTTIDSYYAASMDLLRPLPPIHLNDPDWLIYTPSEDRAPCLLGGSAEVSSSMIAHGTRIEGTVRRSILFPGVHVGAGAVVEDSIVMHDTRVLKGARLHRAIIDKQVRIGEGAEVGMGEPVRHREHPHDLGTGLCVIGKGAEVPSGAKVGRNTLVEIGVRELDYGRDEVPSGSTVRRRPVGAGR